jgi:23S rRNA pseudouridine1911/1915/1917 synthase
MNEYEVQDSQRLDQAVISKFAGLSRAFASKLIEEGKVKVNGRILERPGHKLHPGDNISINYEKPKQAVYPDIAIPVLYEDEDCVVINKPIGVLSHSKGAFNPEATVATWLQSRLTPDLVGERGGIVHRLDRATSGVMICAKTLAAQTWLQEQFAKRQVKKLYQAIVVGQMPHQHAIIDMPIMRNPKKPQRFQVHTEGRKALTEYWVVKTSARYSLMKLQPKTGRTHQLRVHLQALGHPIVGDSFYNGQTAERLYLHAWKLELVLPNRIKHSFTATLPTTFNTLMKS